MACKCGSERILRVSGKTSDLCFVSYGENENNVEHDGYVPKGINIGDNYGDYIEFDLCMQCGTIQAEWPITDEKILEALA